MPSGDVKMAVGRHNGVVHHGERGLAVDEDLQVVALAWCSNSGYPPPIAVGGHCLESVGLTDSPEAVPVMPLDGPLQSAAGDVVELLTAGPGDFDANANGRRDHRRSLRHHKAPVVSNVLLSRKLRAVRSVAGSTLMICPIRR